MAYIDKITNKDTGESRPISPAADKVRVDNENFEGTDLDEVLDEIAEAIEEAGGEGGYTPPQGGIPKTDLAPAVQTSLDKANTAYQKPASGIPATDIADGVIPDVSGLATKTEVDDAIDDALDGFTPADVPTKVSDLTNDAGYQTQQQVAAAINTAVEGIIAGESIVFDTDGTPIADGTLSQNSDSVLAAASARWVKEIDNNVKAILSNLANIAFKNGKPTWAAVAKRTYTLTMSLSGCSGEVVSGSDGNGQVYEGGVQIKLTPTSGYTFTSVMVNSVNVQTTPTGLSDGSVYVDFIANQDMTVSATAVSGFAIAVSGAHVTNSQSHSGSTYTVTLGSDNQHFHLPATIVVKHGSTVLTAGTDYTYNQSTGAVVINNVTDNTFSIEVEMAEDTKYTVTIDATGLTGATATPTPQQVYAGENAVITVVPSVSGYSLDSVKYTVNGGSEQTATISNNQAVITIANVQANTSVVITGSASVPSVSIQHTETNCSLTMPQGTIGVGDTVTIPITAAAGYGINDDVKAACISVKDADNNTDIPFTFSSNTTVAQNEFDSKIDAQIVFTASAANIVISVKAAVLLLKDRTISTGGVLSTDTNNRYCVLAPRIHAKEGTPFAAGDYIFYKFSNFDDSACIVFYKTDDGIMTYFQQAGAQNGKKSCNVGSYVTNNPTDEFRAMFTQQYIESCYISYNTSNTDPAVDPDSGTIDPSAAVIHFGNKPYILFDTSNS